MLLVFCHETATTVYSTDGHPLSLHYSLLISVAGSCRRHAGGDAKIADRARGRRRRERARIRRRFRNRRVRAKDLVDAGSPHRALILATDHHFGDYLRSEEHTSELQSLMRISYAVFCLKKKKKLNNS